MVQHFKKPQTYPENVTRAESICGRMKTIKCSVSRRLMLQLLLSRCKQIRLRCKGICGSRFEWIWIRKCHGLLLLLLHLFHLKLPYLFIQIFKSRITICKGLKFHQKFVKSELSNLLLYRRTVLRPYLNYSSSSTSEQHLEWEQQTPDIRLVANLQQLNAKIGNQNFHNKIQIEQNTKYWL